MKKQTRVLFISLILIVLLSCASFAATAEYITDETGRLFEDEIDSLNEIAEKYYDQYNVALYYAYVSSDFDDFDVSAIVSVDDYVLLLENDSSWKVIVNGSVEEKIGYDEKSRIWDAYCEHDSYYDAITAYFDTCASILNGEDLQKDEEQLFPNSNPGRLYDKADILSESEEQSLLEKLNSVSELYGTDFIVIAVDTVGSYSAGGYAEEFFDRFNYGIGESRNGVMLMLSMKEREYRILSNGFIGDTLDDDAIDSIGDEIVSDLSYGNYFNAFSKFVTRSEYYVNGAINGFPFNYLTGIAISLFIGFIASLITVSSMKKRLKTVNSVNEANAYMRQGSMSLKRANDMFLYATVIRSARTKRSSSSRGRSGGSRHVGGGRF